MLHTRQAAFHLCYLLIYALEFRFDFSFLCAGRLQVQLSTGPARFDGMKLYLQRLRIVLNVALNMSKRRFQVPRSLVLQPDIHLISNVTRELRRVPVRTG